MLIVCRSLAALSAEAQQKQKNDRNLITAEDIAGARVNNGYQAVESGATGCAGPAATIDQQPVRWPVDNADPAMGMQAGSLVVFVDGNEMGSVRELERITSGQIAELRFLTGSDAQTRYGPRLAAGVIQVTLRTGS